jgi:hypothetical protein
VSHYPLFNLVYLVLLSLNVSNYNCRKEWREALIHMLKAFLNGKLRAAICQSSKHIDREEMHRPASLFTI